MDRHKIRETNRNQMDYVSRAAKKELILFFRLVIVTSIFRLLDTGRYSVVAVAHNFPSKSGTDAPRWRPC